MVDVANVMGARADGWWRDRAAAALRMCREVSALAESGIPAGRLPGGVPAGDRIYPGYVVVLEGRSRDAGGRLESLDPRVRVVLAPGSGDDSIVAEAASAVSAGASCLVVTADRELRERCGTAGATVAGPGWLLGLI